MNNNHMGGIDRDMLNRLGQMSDADLREAIRKAARLLGADEKDAALAASKSNLIRQKLTSATDADIKRAVDTVGADTIYGIAKELGVQPKDKGQG